MSPFGQILPTSMPVALRMLAGDQLVRMSENNCATPPESRLPTIMPMAFLPSFSVATIIGARGPFQSNELLSRASATSNVE